jgi:octaprenyl-diphosphate synthase
MQLGAAKNTATTEDDYLAVIRAKTAELFAAACEVGRRSAVTPKDEQVGLPLVRHESRHRLPARGRRARLRRQGRQARQERRRRFREGKITLPVVLSFAADRRASGRSGAAPSRRRRDRCRSRSMPSA